MNLCSFSQFGDGIDIMGEIVWAFECPILCHLANNEEGAFVGLGKMNEGIASLPKLRS